MNRREKQNKNKPEDRRRAGLDGGESARGAGSGGHGVLVVYVGGAEERPLQSASLGVADRFPRPRRPVLRGRGIPGDGA